MPEITAFQPQYYKNFACSGPNCQNTCCQNWKVVIHERDYNFYKSIKDGALKDELIKNIEVTSQDPFKANMKMDKDGYCPYLREDRLCGTHAKHGEKFLCFTCRTYPRQLCQVGKEYEAFLVTSCEEAVKLILFNTDIMKLKPLPTEHDGYANYVLEPQNYTQAENGLDIFWDLRIASVYILQSRKYPLWLRMVILGLFIRKADEYIKRGQENLLRGLCEECMSNINSGVYDGYINQIPDRPDVKANFILGLFNKLYNEIPDKKNNTFFLCLEQALGGFGIAGRDQPGEEIILNFTEVRRRWYAPFFGNREYMLENYIVNTLFRTGFPFTYGKDGGIYANYVNLCMKYTVLKLLLAGVAGFHKEAFGCDEVIKTVTSFSRNFDHSKRLTEQVAQVLENADMTSLEHLSLLLKD